MSNSEERNFYSPQPMAEEYDSIALADEFRRLALAMEAMQVPSVYFVPQHNEPGRYKVGDVVNADGVNWNPGSGAGLYERSTIGWVKL